MKIVVRCSLAAAMQRSVSTHHHLHSRALSIVIGDACPRGGVSFRTCFAIGSVIRAWFQPRLGRQECLQLHGMSTAEVSVKQAQVLL